MGVGRGGIGVIIGTGFCKTEAAKVVLLILANPADALITAAEELLAAVPGADANEKTDIARTSMTSTIAPMVKGKYCL